MAHKINLVVMKCINMFKKDDVAYHIMVSDVIFPDVISFGDVIFPDVISFDDVIRNGSSLQNLEGCF